MRKDEKIMWTLSKVLVRNRKHPYRQKILIQRCFFYKSHDVSVSRKLLLKCIHNLSSLRVMSVLTN